MWTLNVIQKRIKSIQNLELHLTTESKIVFLKGIYYASRYMCIFYKDDVVETQQRFLVHLQLNLGRSVLKDVAPCGDR